MTRHKAQAGFKLPTESGTRRHLQRLPPRRHHQRASRCGIVVFGTAGVVSKSINDASNKVHTITYSVTGDGPADITYDTFTSGNTGSEQANGATLPWTKTLTAKGFFSIYSLGAQLNSGTTISCSITLDGKVISNHTSTGQYANVDCSGSN